MRFSLKWMLAAVAFVGFGCVALYNANEAWAATSRLVTVFVLLIAIVGAIYSEWKAFCVGMCVLGWGFLLLNCFPNPLINMNGLLDAAYRPMVRNFPYEGSVPYGAELTGGGFGVQPTGYIMPVKASFRYVGHSLLALVFAAIGGVVAEWFARTKAGRQ